MLSFIRRDRSKEPGGFLKGLLIPELSLEKELGNIRGKKSGKGISDRESIMSKDMETLTSMGASGETPSFSLLWSKKYTEERNSRRKLKKEREGGEREEGREI